MYKYKREKEGLERDEVYSHAQMNYLGMMPIPGLLGESFTCDETAYGKESEDHCEKTDVIHR